MNPGIRAFGDAVLGRGPLPWLGRRLTRNRLVVLAYHGVDDRASFARHLDHLQRHHSVVSIDEVLAALNGASLPPNAVLITFDDGERTVLTDGLPELQKRSLPSVLFAIAGFIDTDEPFWWYEVESLYERGGRVEAPVTGEGAPALVSALKHVPDDQRLAALDVLRTTAGGNGCRQGQLTADELRHLDANGMHVANHSLTHPLLDRCQDEKIRDEVLTAAAQLEGILQRPMRAFAYPNGNADARVAAAVRDSGADLAFLFDHKVGRWLPEDPMFVSRVCVNSDCSRDRFVAIVSGVHSAFHAIRGAM